MIGDERSIVPFDDTGDIERRLSSIERLLAKGFDVSQIGYKAITADKLRRVGAQTVLDLGTVAAGAFSIPYVLNVATTAGLTESPNYIITKYEDVFVDPSGDLSYNGLYAGSALSPFNLAALDNRDKYHLDSRIMSSHNGDQSLCLVNLQIENKDASSHHYYVAFNVQILASQLTGGQ